MRSGGKKCTHLPIVRLGKQPARSCVAGRKCRYGLWARNSPTIIVARMTPQRIPQLAALICAAIVAACTPSAQRFDLIVRGGERTIGLIVLDWTQLAGSK